MSGFFDGYSGGMGGDEMRRRGWLGARCANLVVIVSPLSLLKNPMILIAVVGLGFVVGMPYLMDSSKFWSTGLLSACLWVGRYLMRAFDSGP